MLANLAGGNPVHAAHTLESLQQRIAQHAERLNRWESQFANWQASWKEREGRLDRELAVLEAKATASRGGLRQLVVYCEDDEE